jgi:hypothetical protein
MLSNLVPCAVVNCGRGLRAKKLGPSAFVFGKDQFVDILKELTEHNDENMLS